MMQQTAADPAAQVVVKAWTDPAYRARLLADPRAALMELGIEYREDIALEVYDNTGSIHHAIVCTPCSCYPGWLTAAPAYWKAPDYKAKINRDAAGTLMEMGLRLGEGLELKVIDTDPARRAMVIPPHPDPGGRLGAAELAEHVTNLTLVGHAR